MDLKELRKLSSEELKDELKTAQEELFNTKFQLATRQMKNFKQMPQARRRIARALTVMGERERSGETK